MKKAILLAVFLCYQSFILLLTVFSQSVFFFFTDFIIHIFSFQFLGSNSVSKIFTKNSFYVFNFIFSYFFNYINCILFHFSFPDHVLFTSADSFVQGFK